MHRRSQNPRQQLRSWTDLARLPGRVECDATLRYVAPIDNQDVPEYTELNLHLSWRPSAAWEFALAGQNLLHAHHPEFGAATSRREIERSVYADFEWRSQL